jgi:hypothetical protein
LAADAAVSWNSKSKPLTVSGYSSTGYGYGSFEVSTKSDGTKARGYNFVVILNPLDHKVFVKQWTYVNAPSTTGNSSCANVKDGGACSTATKTTPFSLLSGVSESKHKKDTTWVSADTAMKAPGTSDLARGEFEVVLDIPYRFDVHSGQSLTVPIKY